MTQANENSYLVNGHSLLTSSISIVELHSKNLVQLRYRIVYDCHSDEF